MRNRFFLTTLVLGGLLLTPGWAQDTPPVEEPAPAPAEEKKADAEALKERLKRFQELTPEQRRELMETYRRRLEGRSPDEIRRLRERMRAERGGSGEEAGPQRPDQGARGPRTAEGDGEGGPRAGHGRRGRHRHRQEWTKLPQDKKERYRRFVEGMLSRLPAEERSRIEVLPEQERQQAIEGLIRSHRARLAERTLDRMPEDVKLELEALLEGLEGDERYKRLHELTRQVIFEELERLRPQYPARLKTMLDDRLAEKQGHEREVEARRVVREFMKSLKTPQEKLEAMAKLKQVFDSSPLLKAMWGGPNGRGGRNGPRGQRAAEGRGQRGPRGGQRGLRPGESGPRSGPRRGGQRRPGQGSGEESGPPEPSPEPGTGSSFYWNQPGAA